MTGNGYGYEKVLVVRPYGRQIRERMFGHLEKAGLSIDEVDVIQAGTPNRAAVTSIRSRPNHVLLVPFHAHVDHDGEQVNGLDVLQLLDEEGGLDAPALMPVSKVGMAAAQLMMSGGGSGGKLSLSARDRILFIDEEELDDPGLFRRIEAHLRRFAR